MGLILDSSILIAAERKGENARQALTSIASMVQDDDIALSAITLLELAHGAARANTADRKEKATPLPWRTSVGDSDSFRVDFRRTSYRHARRRKPDERRSPSIG
jgi:predicted nucleic acid-binding protein